MQIIFHNLTQIMMWIYDSYSDQPYNQDTNSALCLSTKPSFRKQSSKSATIFLLGFSYQSKTKFKKTNWHSPFNCVLLNANTTGLNRREVLILIPQSTQTEIWNFLVLFSQCILTTPSSHDKLTLLSKTDQEFFKKYVNAKIRCAITF